MRRTKTMFAGALARPAVSSVADDAMSLDQLPELFGWDFETVEVREDVIGAKVASEFDETYGLEPASPGFVDRVYTSPTR